MSDVEPLLPMTREVIGRDMILTMGICHPNSDREDLERIGGILMSDVARGAIITPCGRHRLLLWRFWGQKLPMVFYMLNPSTADALIDDPTIKKCMMYAKREGAGGIMVVNLYSFRSAYPADLVTAADTHTLFHPDGLSKRTIRAVVAFGLPIICAWGNNPFPARHWQMHENQAQGARNLLGPHNVFPQFRQSVPTVRCLGTNKDGSPKHPLYLSKTQPLERYP